MSPAKKKPAAKKKAAKRSAPPVQVDRSGSTTPNEVREEPGIPPVEETDDDRAVAGAARREKVLVPSKLDSPPDYEPKRSKLKHAGFDHHSAEERRQAELQRERDAHNRRTGDASR